MKVFIAGARVIMNLNDDVIRKLHTIAKKDYDIMVGDASGVDASVQRFFLK